MELKRRPYTKERECPELFVAESFDGIEFGGFDGGPHTEDEANGDADDDSCYCGPDGDDAAPAQRGADKEHHSVHHNKCQDAAGARQGHGFEQELPGDVAATRADGFANADFASALGDADEHNVHHAHAANQETRSAESDHREVDHRHDAVKFFDFLGGGVDGEIVFSALGYVAAAAQHFRCLVNGLIEQTRISVEAHVHLLGRGTNLRNRAVRNQDAAIFIATAESTLGLFDHADDGERRTINENVFADGMAFGKKNGSHVFAKHDDFF